jgi:restriction system protein
MPKYYELMNPLLKALHELGGSGSIEEIQSRVSESLDLPEDVLSIPHDPEKSSQTEVEYRLAWARTYLKKYGILDNSERGVWVIVPDKREVKTVNPQEVLKTVRNMIRKEREEQHTTGKTEEELPEEAETWQGLFVTTGTFTRDAVREATRDGATPIDLVDGDQLADKLKELHLGIKTQRVESVDVDTEWFKNI